MRKNQLNLMVDSLIGLAFVGSAVSGLVFLLPFDSTNSVPLLGLSLRLWSDLHTVSSLALIAGVLLHLILHARWIATTTQRTFINTDRSAVPARVMRMTSKRGKLL